MRDHPYRIAFFMLPHQLFEILARIVNEHRVDVVFQRFESDGFRAGIHVVPHGADLEEFYREGRFGPIYLSVGGGPQSETDWEFIRRAHDDLINIELGKSSPGQVELSEVYLLAVPSRAQHVFDALEREFAASCHRGVRGSRHAYPNHYWSEEVRSLALYRALGNENTRYWVVEP